MSEQGMRSRVVGALASLGAIAVENPALPGTPDVNYVEGWIELKWLRSWPVGETTVVRFEHFTAQQRVWHLKRRLAGGRSWVLVQCRREWLLFDGAVAAMHLGRALRSELYAFAAKYWEDGLNEKELKAWLSTPQKDFTLTDAVAAKLKELLRPGSECQFIDT